MAMDAVFKALADPVRRELLDSLHARDGQTLGELSEGRPMSRQAVTKHLAILEAANLVATRREGREKFHYLNPVPIHEIAERWIGKYERSRPHALGDGWPAILSSLKSLIETGESLEHTRDWPKEL